MAEEAEAEAEAEADEVEVEVEEESYLVRAANLEWFECPKLVERDHGGDCVLLLRAEQVVHGLVRAELEVLHLVEGALTVERFALARQGGVGAGWKLRLARLIAFLWVAVVLIQRI